MSSSAPSTPGVVRLMAKAEQSSSVLAADSAGGAGRAKVTKMAAHTPTATPGASDARETALPPVARRRPRRSWGRRFARIMCVLFALVGLLPFGATLVLRSTWARTWAATETERLMAAQGITARYVLALRVWPLAVDLDD